MRALDLLSGLMAAHVLYTALRAWRSGTAARSRTAAHPLSDRRAPSGITVLIPAWNDARVLLPTLNACFAEAGRFPGPVQVIVIAGGPDGSFSLARQLVAAAQSVRTGLSAEVLLQPPAGKNAALNLGLRAARHEVLVVLDADTVVSPGWLAALTGPVLRGEVGASTGRFRAGLQTPVSRVFELQQFVNQELRAGVTLFGGSSIALSRQTLNLIGGIFPEDVPVGVDFDLSERIRGAGQRLAYCPDAEVVTEISSTWPEYWRGERRWQRAFLAAQRRHLVANRTSGRLLALVYVPAVYAALLTGWLIAPVVALWAGLGAQAGLLIWLAFIGWVLGRHACTCLEAQAADPAGRWLQLVPASVVGFCVSGAATWAALLQRGPASPHFKGRRDAEPLGSGVSP